jgi:hypothetical protein
LFEGSRTDSPADGLMIDSRLIELPSGHHHVLRRAEIADDLVVLHARSVSEDRGQLKSVVHDSFWASLVFRA